MYTCEHTVVASLERQNLKCELDQEGNEKSIFTMIPKSKIDRDGDVVYSHHSEELLLHYICTQLHKFYSCQLSSYEEHQRRWKEILTKAKTSLVKTVSCLDIVTSYFCVLALKFV